MRHSNRLAGDFARFLFASTDPRPSCTRVAEPNAVPARLNVDLDLHKLGFRSDKHAFAIAGQAAR